ncbi:hypothetical protein FEM33_17580 [Dyadobacter flavalbus]|uniref:Uncharacterized protein n=1 Tax=Dyadobacter flavalbus TaxID=2579942 RepID=A0A5M8QTB4_9BACT|nr:hypothetical protein [Dyadobacter flavalbus]KAA6438498.1 hypothetical protein FEM33_17580 [Dyadobacter flavalbus]
MRDFANFDKEESYFQPTRTHLDVHVKLRKTTPELAASQNWTYRLKIFCSVPVLLFSPENGGCNTLIHLNHVLLTHLNATCWLKAEKLTFMLFISDASIRKEVVCVKAIQLSVQDSARVRKACKSQNGLSYHQVESLVDIIYQLNITEIWPPEMDAR